MFPGSIDVRSPSLSFQSSHSVKPEYLRVVVSFPGQRFEARLKVSFQHIFPFLSSTHSYLSDVRISNQRLAHLVHPPFARQGKASGLRIYAESCVSYVSFARIATSTITDLVVRQTVVSPLEGHDELNSSG